MHLLPRSVSAWVDGYGVSDVYACVWDEAYVINEQNVSCVRSGTYVISETYEANETYVWSGSYAVRCDNLKIRAFYNGIFNCLVQVLAPLATI